ncbi:MAG: PAS domain S-box protein, partial [Nitrospiria bacterium]
MGEPVRVLIVDDSEDDAQLVLCELRYAGYDPQHVRVDGADALRAVLDQSAWDIVICDYSMPRFSMQEAMELLRLRGLDVPFIVVSGQIGEETAVAAMKAGANDYVMKGNLPRLGPAVRREVREARARQDRLLANRALRESEEQFRELLEAEPDVVVIADAAGKIMLVNSHVEAVLGYSREELVGRPVELLVPESSRDAHRAHRGAYGERPQARPMGVGAELTARRKDGRELPVEVSLRPHTVNGVLFVTAVIRDVSERRRLEAQFRHAQKMEAVGRLAGGMAHDFNNLLTAILGFAELSIERTPPESPTGVYLEEVRKAAERAASLTRQLLAFGRRQVLEPRVLDVNTVVRDLERLLRRLIGEDVEFLMRVGPAPAM